MAAKKKPTKRKAKATKPVDQYIVVTNDDRVEFGPGTKEDAQRALASILNDSADTAYGEVTQDGVDEAITRGAVVLYKVTKVSIGAGVETEVNVSIYSANDQS